MKGERFEDYVILLVTAVGYENAHKTGNNPHNKAVDIVAAAPGRGLVAVECKRQKAKVNGPAVTKLVGAVNMAPMRVTLRSSSLARFSTVSLAQRRRAKACPSASVTDCGT